MVHQFQSTCCRFSSGTVVMVHDRLNELCTDFQNRIQEGHRILEDHTHRITADLPHFIFIFPFGSEGRRCNIFSVKGELSFFDLTVVCQQTNQGIHCLALTGTGFTNDTQGFTLINMQRYSTYRLYITLFCIERSDHILYL